MRAQLVICSAAVWVLGLLSACAGYSPAGFSAGATLPEVTKAMGAPTGEYPLAGGNKRVEFARGPAGKHTYMLDFDGAGRLLSWEQVLTESRFNAVVHGMSADQVLLSLGQPAERRPLSFQKRLLWSYRYESPFCQWFQVGLDMQGRVVDTGYGPDPLCEVNDTDRGPL